MALSIQQNANIKPVMHNRVENKGSQSQYSDNSQGTTIAEKKSPDNNEKDDFNMGLSWLMNAGSAEEVKNKNTVLTGIIEMNAIGLQFFLAMQRQIVHLRLSSISAKNYPAEIHN